MSDWKNNTYVHPTELTSATKLTMLMLKLTFCSEFLSSSASIKGMESNQADTYMIGAERKVPITIPDVTCGQQGRGGCEGPSSWIADTLHGDIISCNTPKNETNLDILLDATD